MQITRGAERDDRREAVNERTITREIKGEKVTLGRRGPPQSIRVESGRFTLWGKREVRERRMPSEKAKKRLAKAEKKAQAKPHVASWQQSGQGRAELALRHRLDGERHAEALLADQRAAGEAGLSVEDFRRRTLIAHAKGKQTGGPRSRNRSRLSVWREVVRRGGEKEVEEEERREE